MSYSVGGVLSNVLPVNNTVPALTAAGPYNKLSDSSAGLQLQPFPLNLMAAVLLIQDGLVQWLHFHLRGRRAGSRPHMLSGLPHVRAR